MGGPPNWTWLEEHTAWRRTAVPDRWEGRVPPRGWPLWHEDDCQLMIFEGTADPPEALKTGRSCCDPFVRGEKKSTCRGDIYMRKGACVRKRATLEMIFFHPRGLSACLGRPLFPKHFLFSPSRELPSSPLNPRPRSPFLSSGSYIILNLLATM